MRGLSKRDAEAVQALRAASAMDTEDSSSLTVSQKRQLFLNKMVTAATTQTNVLQHTFSHVTTCVWLICSMCAGST